MREILEIKSTEITSDFWKRYRKLIADVVIPYQYETLADENEVEIANDSFTEDRFYGEKMKSHAIENLKIAAGISEGSHVGMNFQDTDVYKWLEAAAYSLKYSPNQKTRERADQIVQLISEAQSQDGYLSTLFQIEIPERKFKRLEQSHELYSMGHYIEAGVAYYEVTGNKLALAIAEKMVNFLVEVFGPNEGQIHGYDGHPEIELAIMRLWEITKKQSHLDLVEFFVRERGKDTGFFTQQNIADGLENDFWPDLRGLGLRYYYADKPITEQVDAHGHAVRCVYFCVALAHLARVTEDEDLQASAKRIWDNIVQKQIYITGNVGQSREGEAFTFDYDLPNDTMYGETCASCAMTFYARQMRAGVFKSEFGDIIEKELFNGALSGISLDGKHYFYVNPLEVDPKATELDPNRRHVLTRRQSWFGTACCPSNITRLIASVDRYIYEVKDDVILADQYIANTTEFNNEVTIIQESNFPWDGNVTFKISNPKKINFKFAYRIPSWTEKKFEIFVNGAQTQSSVKEGIGYIDIDSTEVMINIEFDMSVHLVRSKTEVRDNLGKVAIQRGPIIYCAEEADNGKQLFKFYLDKDPKFSVNFHPDVLGGVNVISTSDVYRVKDNYSRLYSLNQQPVYEKSELKLIPYYAWANRSEGEMCVWLHG